MQLGRAILAAEPSRTVRLSFVVCAALAACGPAPARGPMPPLTGEAYAAYLAGRMAVHRDDWAAAADALAEAATAAPDQPVIAVELARAQHRARRTDAAGATLATARARWPDHPQVWLVSGELLAATAPAEARRAFVRAIELAPDDERAYLGLAALQPPGDALATLRRLVAANPDAIDGRYRFGQRLANARELPAAIRELRAVLERDPDHIDARLDLARLLRWQGQIAEAVAQTRSAFDRSGQALDVAEELFWVLCEADDRTAAIDLLTLLDDERSDLEALGTVARLERSLGRIDDARAIAARIAKLDADAGAIALAELELDAGDPAGAARRALGIASSSERFVDARRLAASALLAAGEPGRALDALGPARATKPDHAELATLAGYALVELGRSTELAGVLDPLGDQPAARFARARVAERAGDTARALALVEPLARTEQVAALNLAGYLLADRNERLADAERYLRRARELAPGDPAVLDSWGWLLLRRGDSRGAVRALDQAARFAPREPEILVHLAAAWAADGAPRTAALTLDRAAALHPTAAIQRRIDRVRSSLPPRR